MVQVQESKIKFVVQDPLLQRFLEAKEALDELGKLLADVAARVRPYAEKYRGYSLEKTWVLNKLKKRYYYYYLKANDGRKPSSIYLGSMPADYPLCKFISGYLKNRGPAGTPKENRCRAKIRGGSVKPAAKAQGGCGGFSKERC